MQEASEGMSLLMSSFPENTGLKAKNDRMAGTILYGLLFGLSDVTHDC
jgi:hypothetical protein